MFHSRHISALPVIAALVAPAFTLAQQPEAAPAAAAKVWNVRDAIPLEDFAIQAHRGAGSLAPENSRESFELAWSLGTIPEADLRTTKDGVIVSFHDKDFQRILPHESEEMRKKGIEHFTWDELSKIDVGIWKGEEFKGQRIPSLANIFEMLRENPKRKIYVDIKNVDLKQLADEAHKAKLANRMILASTKYELIREWKALAPDSFTLHWMGGSEKELAKRLSILRTVGFASVDQLQIHVHPAQDGKSFTPSPEFLQKTGATLRRHKVLFQTLPWESQDPEMFTQLLDLGVASFATDYPDITAKAVKSYYAAGKENE